MASVGLAAGGGAGGLGGLATGAGILQGASGLTGAFGSVSEGKGNATQARNSAALDRLTLLRLTRDEARDTGLVLGSIKAAIAQSGGDAGANNLLLTGAAERSRTITRAQQDSLFRQKQLKAQASNEKNAGFLSGLGGAGNALVDGVNLFRKLSK